MKRVGICAVLSTALFGVAAALTRPYAVDPQTASQSGRVKQPSFVGQYVVCVWDSLSYPGRVELFTGDVGGQGRYTVEVKDSATSEVIARQRFVTPKGNHQWLPFDSLEIIGPFVRGRTVLFSFTRESPDSIHYYYRQDEYAYGSMVVGGQAQEDNDLACRVYGTCKPVGPEYFGFNVGWPRGESLNLIATKAQDAGVAADRFGFGWNWMEQSPGNFVWPSVEFEWSHYTLKCEELGLLRGKSVTLL